MLSSIQIKMLIKRTKSNHLCNKNIDSTGDRVKVQRESLNNHRLNKRQGSQKLYLHLRNKNLACMEDFGGKILLGVYLLIEGTITISQTYRRMLGSTSKFQNI